MIGLLWQAGWSCTNRLVPGGPVQTAALTDRYMLTLSNCYRRRPQHLGNYAAIALQVISTGAGQLLVQDPVGLAVDPVLVRLAELACLLLGGGPRFRLHPVNPILSAAHLPFAANAVFNAGAARLGDETILLLRVEDLRGISHLQVARSYDGVDDWRFDADPLLSTDTEHHPEEVWGCED